MKLATGSLPFIVRSIRRFWASDAYGVDEHTLRITHPTKDMNDRYRVRAIPGGYVFEHVPQELPE